MKYFFSTFAAIIGVISSCIAAPSESSMAQLGKQAAGGDFTAVDKIDAIREELYQGIDYTKDRPRLISNLALMRAALDEIALSIRSNRSDDTAFEALLYASKKKELAGFCADSFGLAAANGNAPSLEVLLQHANYGILLSSAVIGLQKPARKGNKEAVTFLINIIDDDSCKPLWNAASKGIEEEGKNGNREAQRALQKYADFKQNKQ